MKFALRGVNAEEMSFKLNPIKMKPGERIELNPQFGHMFRKADEKIWIAGIEVKIESTEDKPKPYNLKVRMVGVFEAEEVDTKEDEELLKVSAIETVFPYVRAAISGMTANAFVQPVVLPVFPGSLLVGENAPESDSIKN